MNIHWPDNLDAAKFLRDYWQQKPLLIRQAFPDFDNPLSPDELGGLALDDEIHSRLILQQRTEDPAQPDIWHLRTGPFSTTELTELPSEDWSLLVSDIEKHLDGFHTYLEPFRFLPDWRIDDLMISYAPTGASVGAHIDAYDVFLLQASGQREWAISTDSRADHTLIPNLDIRVLQQFNPDHRWVLSPGDLLYLPPGIPHHGVSLDMDCMSWSIGFRAPTHATLIADITEQLHGQDHQRYQDAALTPVNCNGEIDPQTLSAVKLLWLRKNHPDEAIFQRAVGRVLTQPNADHGARCRQSASTEEFQQALSHEDIKRDPRARFAFIRQQDATWLFVDGEEFAVTAELAECLCNTYLYEAGRLPGLCTSAENRACLLTLWQQNVLLRL